MAFPLEQGLQLDSLWSSSDIYLDKSLEDHGVSRLLVPDEIALEAPVWQWYRPLWLALTVISCSAGVRVSVFSVTLRLHRKPSSSLCSCWTRRTGDGLFATLLYPWEFGDIHSLAASAFVTSKLLPNRGLDVAPPQHKQHPLQPGGSPQPVRTFPGLLTALAASLHGATTLTLRTSWTSGSHHS